MYITQMTLQGKLFQEVIGTMRLSSFFSARFPASFWRLRVSLWRLQVLFWKLLFRLLPFPPQFERSFAHGEFDSSPPVN
jgi:hypothetical protein